MRPFKAVRFSRNSKSGLIRNIINAGIRPAYEKVRSIFPYDKGDHFKPVAPVCGWSLLFLSAFLSFTNYSAKMPTIFTLPLPTAPILSLSFPESGSMVLRTFCPIADDVDDAQ